MSSKFEKCDKCGGDAMTHLTTASFVARSSSIRIEDVVSWPCGLVNALGRAFRAHARSDSPVGLEEPTPTMTHQHKWQPLGFRHVDGAWTYVVQSCECGDAREITAQTVAPWDEAPDHANVTRTES